MTLRIERSVQGTIVVFGLSGRIDGEHVEELKRLFRLESSNHSIVLDLKDVTLVDQNGVIFLASCEAIGWELTNCPAYIREWIAGGRDQGNQRQRLRDEVSKTPAVNATNEDKGGFDVKR